MRRTGRPEPGCVLHGRAGLCRRAFSWRRRNQGAAIVRPQDFMQVDLASEPLREPGKPPLQLFAGGRFAQLLAQQEFAVDQLEGRLVVLADPRWVPVEVGLRRDPLARSAIAAPDRSRAARAIPRDRPRGGPSRRSPSPGTPEHLVSASPEPPGGEVLAVFRAGLFHRPRHQPADRSNVSSISRSCPVPGRLPPDPAIPSQAKTHPHDSHSPFRHQPDTNVRGSTSFTASSRTCQPRPARPSSQVDFRLRGGR